MKIIFKTVGLALLAITIASCDKKTESNSTTESTVSQDSFSIKLDEETLSNDSATVKTAVGFQDEEKNALEQEKLEAQKLKTDEEKLKKIKSNNLQIFPLAPI